MAHRKKLRKQIASLVDALSKKAKSKGFSTSFKSDIAEVAYDEACSAPWRKVVDSPFLDNAPPERLQKVIHHLGQFSENDGAYFNRLQAHWERKRRVA